MVLIIIGSFSFSSLKFSGKLSNKFVIAIYSDVFSNIYFDLYQPGLLVNEILKENNYYFYFQTSFSKTCQIGQYYDSKKLILF